MKVPVKPFSLNRLIALAGLAATLVLSGCGGDSNSSSVKPTTGLKNAGVVAFSSSNFGSGGVSVINMDSGNYDISGPYHETGSDIAVVGGVGHYYLLGRYQMDNISKVELSNLARKTWDEFSVILPGEQAAGNPYDLVKVNDQKAYLIRYDSPKVLIVNPSATNEKDFYTGKFLDLSEYTPADNAVNGAPQVSSATIADDRLFITLQRLEKNGYSWEPNNRGYVAVFDTNTNEEIDTELDTENGFKGIPLLGKNPENIQYHPSIGIVVQNLGTNSGNLGYGNGTSLDKISIASGNYAIDSLVEATTSAAEGQIMDFVIVNDSLGYIINVATYGKAAVQSFVPADGRSSFTTIGDLDGDDYRDIELSPKGNLWLADANLNNPGIRIINTNDNSEIKFVESSWGLYPNNIAFVTEK